jgi:glycosyl transferase family 25
MLNNIYVINVKTFVQRRSFMQQQLNQQGLTAEFIVDADDIDLTAEMLLKFFRGYKLSLAQQSCAMKHVLALERIVAKQQQFNLILEDDAVFSAEFKRGIQQALEESKNFSGPKVIFIGSGGNFFTPKSQRKPGQSLYIGTRGRFADSYIIDWQTAQQRLNWIQVHKISEPIDNQFEIIDRQLKIKMLWLEDPIVEQGSKNGLFNSALEATPRAWIQGLLFRWEKLKRKYIYQLWR